MVLKLKKILFLVLFCIGLLGLSVFNACTQKASQTTSPRVSGSVSGSYNTDQEWSGEIQITDTVTIGPTATLTIKPGTIVKFKHYRGYQEPEKRLYLIIEGGIIAEGTAEQPIYFTSDASDPVNGDWSMVNLSSPQKETRIRYAVFEFAQQGLNVWHSTDLQLSHVVFRWNNWEGLYFENYSQATIENCQIYENGYNGMAAEQYNTLRLSNCEIWRNGTNGIHVDASNVSIESSFVHENKASGLSVDDNGTLTALGVKSSLNNGCGIDSLNGDNTIEIANLVLSGNGGGSLCGSVTEIQSALTAPNTIDLGFTPSQTNALSYIPGDENLDPYLYVYPDDETRKVIRKIGKTLGLTWSLTWDGSSLWSADLSGTIYQLNPLTGEVIKQFLAPGPQPWGMTYDGQNLWVVDFAEKTLKKINPENGQTIQSFSTPDPEGGCKGITWDGTYLNIMGWTSSIIYQVNPSNGSVAQTISLDQGGGGGITWDGTHFWVPSSGKIIRYDTQGHAVSWIYAASEGTWDLAWDGTYLWATQRTNETWNDDKIFALEILKTGSF